MPGEHLEQKNDHRKLKTTAQNNPGMPTRSVLTVIAEGKNEQELANLPSQTSMKRAVQRSKNALLNDPKNPFERTGFEIDEKYTKYCGEFFLRCDTGEDDPDRILIFVTDEGIKDLKTHDHYSTDGTFKSSPKNGSKKLFQEVITIHVHINETQTAARYVFINQNQYIPDDWYVLYLVF